MVDIYNFCVKINDIAIFLTLSGWFLYKSYKKVKNTIKKNKTLKELHEDILEIINQGESLSDTEVTKSNIMSINTHNVIAESGYNGISRYLNNKESYIKYAKMKKYNEDIFFHINNYIESFNKVKSIIDKSIDNRIASAKIDPDLLYSNYTTNLQICKVNLEYLKSKIIKDNFKPKKFWF